MPTNPLTGLIHKDQKILCAVSGWPDSMRMWHTILDFWQTQKWNTKNIVVLYCDHQTRTNKARNIIQSYNDNRCTLAKATRSWKNNKTEASMRQRRYEQIQKTATKYKANIIIFGHNLTDRIESAFINMLRGCGIQWLTSLKNVEYNHPLLPNHIIYRPLADTAKEDITKLCKQYKIPYETDPTNKDNSYSLRNKLRNDILKKLYKQANQGKNGNAFHQSRKNIFSTIEKIPTTIHRTKLATHPDRKAKRSYTYSQDKKLLTTDDLYKLCQQQQQKNNITQKILDELQQFCMHKHQGHKYRNGMYFFASKKTILIIAAPKNFWLRKKNMKKKIVNTTTQRDKLKLETPKEYLWQHIQYITQDGYKKGSKSRSKRCINQKIPLIRRNHIPVIVKAKQITKIYTTFIPNWYIWTLTP